MGFLFSQNLSRSVHVMEMPFSVPAACPPLLFRERILQQELKGTRRSPVPGPLPGQGTLYLLDLTRFHF